MENLENELNNLVKNYVDIDDYEINDNSLKITLPWFDLTIDNFTNEFTHINLLKPILNDIQKLYTQYYLRQNILETHKLNINNYIDKLHNNLNTIIFSKLSRDILYIKFLLFDDKYHYINILDCDNNIVDIDKIYRWLDIYLEKYKDIQYLLNTYFYKYINNILICDGNCPYLSNTDNILINSKCYKFTLGDKFSESIIFINNDNIVKIKLAYNKWLENVDLPLNNENKNLDNMFLKPFSEIDGLLSKIDQYKDKYSVLSLLNSYKIYNLEQLKELVDLIFRLGKAKLLDSLYKLNNEIILLLKNAYDDYIKKNNIKDSYIELDKNTVNFVYNHKYLTVIYSYYNSSYLYSKISVEKVYPIDNKLIDKLLNDIII